MRRHDPDRWSGTCERSGQHTPGGDGDTGNPRDSATGSDHRIDSDPTRVPSQRIVIITIADLPEGGGHTSRLKTLACCLAGLGHSVRIWSKHVLGQFPAYRLALRGRLDGVEFEVINGSLTRTFGWRTWWMKLKSTALLASRLVRERRGVDIVWLNELSFHDMLPLMVLARCFRKKIIHSYEDEHFLLCTERRVAWWQRLTTGWDYRLADRWLAPRADAVVVISRYLRDKYTALGCRPVVLVPTIISCERWHCGPRLRRARLRFLYSGSLAETYAVAEIVEALGVLAAEGRDFEIRLIGMAQQHSAYEETVRRRARALGLADRVTFEQFLPLEEVRRRICEADVLLCIRKESWYGRSGLPTKLSEYLASGRLVVTSGVGDVGHYVRDGESALIVSSTRAEDIVGVLRRCLEGGADLDRIAAAGAEVARAHFDEKVVGRTLDRMLAQVAGAEETGPPAA